MELLLVCTSIAGGFVLSLWWGRGGPSRVRMVLAALLGVGVVAVPFAADWLLRGLGGSAQDPWLLAGLGFLSLAMSHAGFRSARSIRRFGTRPVTPEVLGEIERARQALGGPQLEGVAGPPIGLLMQAGAGGLGNPFVVVTNSLVHCLEPEERRAILGHEVAHHATGSLWFLVAIPALAPELALVVASGASGLALFALTVVLRTVLYCATSRPFEYLCDALGARVESREVMARALSRLVFYSPLDYASRASRILHTFWTHPATDRRLARLAKPARSGQLLRDVVPPLVVVVAIVVAARAFAPHALGAFLLVVLGIGLLFRLALKPNPWKALQKVPAPRRLLFWGWVGCSLGSLVLMVAGAGLGQLVLFLVALAILLLSLACLPVVGTIRGRAFRRRRDAMLQLAEAPAALVEARRAGASVFARDPVLLHAAAMAKVRTGDWDGADEDYESLLQRWPRFLMPRATWAEQIYREDPQRALMLLAEVPAENPTVGRIMVESWLRLGDVEKAKDAILPALAKAPLDSSVLAGRTSIALAEGRVDEAHEILEEAARQGAFGDPTLLILSARVAMAMGELEIAEKGLDKAAAMLEGLPLEAAVLRPDLLEARAELESL